jgi:hypothetical protein
MNLLSLYDYVEEQGIDIDWFSLSRAKSLSMPLPNGGYGIAIDPWKMETVAEEKCCIAHEAGHCMTGSFYNQYATCDLVARHENRADKWAIRTLVPKDRLEKAAKDGYLNLWELSEQFGVTEDFMKKAVCLYKNGNLADVI